MKIRRSRKNPESVQQENTFFDNEKGLSKGVTITQGESGAFFQPKLTVGRPGDRFEQEADATADAVVNRTEVPREESVQRRAPAEEEEMAQARPDVQRQGLENEEEAVQAQGMEEEEDVVQPKLEIRRQVEEEEEPVQAKPQDGGATLATRLRRNRGHGNPLPPRIQSEMEGAFATDFSAVRVHTDEESVQMNQQLRAQAFTNGTDIYFNEGKMSPNSRSGKHLLAHELTHVVQQSERNR